MNALVSHDHYKCKAGSSSHGRNQKKASVVLYAEAESSPSIVQNIKLQRELLLMAENSGQRVFHASHSFSAAVQPLYGGMHFTPPDETKPPLCIRLYGPVAYPPIHKKVLAQGQKAMY